jgi:hypothetical protein
MKSESFNKLYIYDDNSTDGSSEFVTDLLKRNEVPHEYSKTKIGNSIHCINHTVNRSKQPYLFKVDNDILIPSCFDRMVRIMEMPENKRMGFMMMEEKREWPFFNELVTWEEREHIGGVGIMRKKVIDDIQNGNYIIPQKRYWGFTKLQQTASKHGWKAAHIVGAGMMILDRSESYSRTREYEEKGWGRRIEKNDYSIFEPYVGETE